jgi:hypothetical protein
VIIDATTIPAVRCDIDGTVIGSDTGDRLAQFGVPPLVR